MQSDKTKVSSGIGRMMLYRGGERIFSEGQPGKEMYVVESGKIRIFLTTQSSDLTLAVLKRGDFFGEMALLEDLPRSASAAAVEETRLIAIGKDDFKFLIQEHPEIAMKVLGRFSGRLRDADNLINLLLLGERTGLIIQELIRRLAIEYGNSIHMPKECVLPVSMAAIAEQTGLELEQTRMIFNELSRLALVSETPEGIVVRKYNKLKSYLDYFSVKDSQPGDGASDT